MSNNPFMIGLPTMTTRPGEGLGHQASTQREHSRDRTGLYPTSPSSLDRNMGEKSNFGMVNYSPKHSRKPSSLTSNRKINVKHLSLNFSLFDTKLSPKEFVPNGLASKTNINRKKMLTLDIPTHSTTKSIPEQLLLPPQQQQSLILELSDTRAPDRGLRSATDSNICYNHMWTSPAKIDESNGYTTHEYTQDYTHGYTHEFESAHKNQSTSNEDNEQKLALMSPFTSNHLIDNLSKVKILKDHHHNPKLGLPEELQEQNQLVAYPKGPANVLNDSIFLYSDPNDASNININDFDLVINVAKECKDLSAYFNTHNGSKEYLYIPWSHTSLILKELPQITKKIEQFDDSNKEKDKRKVLVHCQCGVSRSACVIVAYFMFKFNIGVNEAYELLKSGTNNFSEATNKAMKNKGYKIDACDRICPNMSLIFELMEFGEFIHST